MSRKEIPLAFLLTTVVCQSRARRFLQRLQPFRPALKRTVLPSFSSTAVCEVSQKKVTPYEEFALRPNIRHFWPFLPQRLRKYLYQRHSTKALPTRVGNYKRKPLSHSFRHTFDSLICVQMPLLVPDTLSPKAVTSTNVLLICKDGQQ
jgi:hypothetical protein